MTKNRYTLALAALLIALVGFSLLPAGSVAAQAVTVKNYFARCAGTLPCDNILTLTGTWKIGSTTVSGTAAELNTLAGVTAGTVTASKALVVDANKDLASLRHLTLTGNLVSGATTLSEADLALVDGLTAGTPAASKALTLDANAAVSSATKHALGGGATTTTALSAASLNDPTSTASGTVQNTEYTLNSVALPASAFNASTRGIRCVAWGLGAANANAKNIKFYFGGTSVVTLTGTTDSAKSYLAEITVLRSGASTQTAYGQVTSDVGAPDAFATTVALAETETNAITIALKTANTAAAAASATGQGMSCVFLN